MANDNYGMAKPGGARKRAPSPPRHPKKAVPQDAPEPAPDITLDDVISLLIQLEPSHIAELAQVRSMLDALVRRLPDSDPARRHFEEAMALLERVRDASSSDPAGDITQALNALDGIRTGQELQPVPKPSAPPVCPGPPQAEPESPCVGESVKLPADADTGLLGEFVTECRDLLERAEAALLSLETDPDNMDAVNTVFRTFHTVKGTSGFLGLAHVQEFAHLAESLLSRVRDREIRFAGVYADLALRSADVLKELTEGVQELLAGREAALPGSYAEMMRLLENPAAAQGAPPAKAPLVEASVKGLPPAPAAVAEVPASAAKAAPDSGDPAVVSGAAPAQASKVQRRVPAADSNAESSLRVRTDRLDRLVDMVGELVIAQSMLSQDGVVHQAGHHDLLRKVTHAGKIVRELQDLAMSMRMVPLKGVFQKMARLVRDLTHKSGKTIEFIAEGEETEIDRNMVDVLSDPLVHMVRNAIDHGIEPPDVRVAMGKPAAGTVRLAAYHSGGNVVLELQDDGKGLDREKIVEKAIAKGLLESEKNLSDSEALHLIFLPGFSTADKVTEISGRGVGMDVVRKNVEALRGRIDLSSEPGKGCTFFVRLPLTLAITDGMLVKVGGERYIIPTVNIHLSFRPDRSSLWSVAGRGEMVMLREELMPVFRLHQLFSIPGAVSDPTEGLLVVVGEGEQRCALLVDCLLGQQQVVAKSLGEGLAKVPGIAGGAILGDGRVGLILDAAEVVSLARQGSGADNLSAA